MGGEDMKKIVFVVAFAAFAFAGCQKEVSFETSQTNDIVLTAISDNYPESKTVLDGVHVLWNNGDCIAVYNGNQVAEFSTDAADKSATADFTTTYAEFAAAENYLAVYPNSDGLAFEDGKVTVTVPASQTATSGSFDPKANVAVASGAANALQFKNVCSYLKFTVPANMTDLTKVVLSAKGGEALAGSVKAVCDDASFEVVSGVSSVVLEGSFEAGKSYYIAVLPGTLSQGFTLTMTRSGETSTMTTKTAFTFTRSHSANIGELYDGTWKVALEGCNVPAGTVMENNGDGYCVFNGNLSAGELKMRVLYENITLDPVTIPAEGWYHIILNINERTYKVYNQAVYVDLGNKELSATPWTNVNSAKASSVSLNDFNGNDSGFTLTVGSGFELYSTSNVTVTERGNYAYKGDILLMKVWYDGLTFSGTDKSTDSGVKNITISGLGLSATYDVRIVSVRFNGSKTARKTKFSINDSDAVTIQQGLMVGGTGYLNYEAVPINEYVAEFNDVKPTEEGNLEISVQAIATGKASDAHVNAIQIFRKL